MLYEKYLKNSAKNKAIKKYNILRTKYVKESII